MRVMGGAGKNIAVSMVFPIASFEINFACTLRFRVWELPASHEC